MSTQLFEVTQSLMGERVDVGVATILKISRSAALKLIKNGGVKVDGELTKPSFILSAGDKITVQQFAEVMPDIAPPDLDILYEDSDVMVVNKPAGLAVHLSETGRPQPTVAAFAAARGVVDSDIERPGIVHRLDKDTSGVIVIAKAPIAKEYMQKLFAKRQVSKTYWALVAGRLKDSEATIRLPVDRSRSKPVKRSVVPGGRAAVTHYKVLEELPGASLIEVSLETGRTHQIRVHFNHLGHPVVGDRLYNNTKGAHALSRQFLHAKEISFMGPSNQLIKVSCPLPDDLSEYLNGLRDKI